MRSMVSRVLVACLIAVLVTAAARVAVAGKGDALLLGVTTNDATAFDTKVRTAAPDAGLWIDETGPGAALRATASNGGVAGRFDGNVQLNGSCTGCLGR